MKKKLVASIFLSNSKAVIGYHDLRLLFEDPVQLALKYSEYHADELLITDLSESDDERERHLDLIKEICDKVQIPVMGSCKVKKISWANTAHYHHQEYYNCQQYGSREILRHNHQYETT